MLALLFAAAAAPGPRDLQQAEQARAAQQAARAEAEARSAAARAEEQRLAAERVAAAAQLRGLETATADAAGRVAELAQRQREAEARLGERAAEMAPVLPVLERLALYPAETLLALPLPAEDAVRGLLLLGGISRQIEADAASAREDEAETARLRQDTEAAMPALAAAEAAQAHAAAALDQQIGAARAARQEANDVAAEAARRAAAEASRAETLRAALTRLDAERRAAAARARAEADAARHRHDAGTTVSQQREVALTRPAGPGLAGPQARLTVPVAGRVARFWGEAAEAGPATGITYAAAPAARVVAPCGGRVVFGSPFRSYGLLLIIDCGGGWHAVLAGLERLDARVGDPVQPGEPVGAMAAWDPRAGTARPALYLELRHAGQPVDPAPYLRGTRQAGG